MQRRVVTLGLVVGSTILAMMGTDLVLPAVPHLPELLGGNAASAQLIVSIYLVGTCLGLLAFGALGDRVSTTRLFVGSLLATSACSVMCSLAPSISTLMALRGVQGFVLAAPAVFAAGIIKASFDKGSAVRAIGVISSIEALGPAVAPIAGAALLTIGGWRLSFEVMAGVSLLLALGMIANGGVPQVSRRGSGSFMSLVRDPIFLRYALGQAAVLSGLIVFVVGMPTVLIRVNGGTTSDYVIMQLCGVATFMIAANLGTGLANRFGAERVIVAGTWVAAAGGAGQLVYALGGGTSALVISALFVPVNVGLGVRGPSAFYRAILASHGDDGRASALVVLFMLFAASVGTGVISPFIERGMVPVAAVSLFFHFVAVGCGIFLPRLEEPDKSAAPNLAEALRPPVAS